MKLGLINSAWVQANQPTVFGLQKTKEIGFDTVDIFIDPLDGDVAERFTAMYVTERTRDMGPEGREALSRLFSQSATNSAEVPVDVVSLV